MYPDEILKRFENKPSVRHKSLIPLVAVFFFFGSIFFISYKLKTPVGEPTKSRAADATLPWSYPRKMNVLVLAYQDPNSQSKAKTPGVIDAHILELKNLIETSSKFLDKSDGRSNAIAVNIVDKIYINAAPFTPCQDKTDYKCAYDYIFSQPVFGLDVRDARPICERLVPYNIDQIWFVADPTTGSLFKGNEFELSIRGADKSFKDYSNHVVYCNNVKTFTLLYIDSSLFIDTTDPKTAEMGNAFHSLGHMMENLILLYQDEDLFSRFTGVRYSDTKFLGGSDAGFGLRKSCGNVHFPPNAPIEPGTTLYASYQYDEDKIVSNGCENWKPGGGYPLVDINTDTWTSKHPFYSKQERYLVWWFSHLPNINNGYVYEAVAPSQLIPNWWDFLLDYDNTPKTYIEKGYFMSPWMKSVFQTTTTSSCSAAPGSVSTNCTGSNL